MTVYKTADGRRWTILAEKADGLVFVQEVGKAVWKMVGREELKLEMILDYREDMEGFTQES